MGRFSPTVAPTWGQSLGHALEGGVDAFLQARRQKQAQEDEMFGRGYRPATDADNQPPTTPAPAAPTPTPFQPATPAAGVQPIAPSLAGPDGAQALAGGPPPNFKGRPQPGQPAVDPQLMAQALATHVQSGQPLQYQPGQAAPPTPQAVGQALAPRHPLQLGGRQWMRTDEAQAAMDQAAQDRALKESLTHSEIFKNAAQGTKDLRDPNPPAAVSYEHVVDPVTGKVTFFNPKAPPTDLTLSRAPKPDAADGIKFKSDQANKILDDYARDTKDFHQVMGGWEVLKGATKDPSLATKFAITDAYARITNPGALVRPTTMEMIDHMGSLGQRMEKAWSQSKDGSLPPEIVKDFQKTLYNIVQEHKTQFDQIRSKAVLRGKAANVDVDPFMQTYDVQDPSSPPAAGPIGTSGSKVLHQAPKSAGGDTGNVDLGAPAKPVPTFEQWKASKGHH